MVALFLLFFFSFSASSSRKTPATCFIGLASPRTQFNDQQQLLAAPHRSANPQKPVIMSATTSVAAAVCPSDEHEKLAAEVSSLKITSAEPGAAEQASTPHRSHDPQFNQKRSDPFQFGSRLLQENDNVFEYNAWDHVETDDAYKEYAEQQYAMQRDSPVSDFDKCEYTFISFLHLCPLWTSESDDLHHSIVHLNFHHEDIIVST